MSSIIVGKLMFLNAYSTYKNKEMAIYKKPVTDMTVLIVRCVYMYMCPTTLIYEVTGTSSVN